MTPIFSVFDLIILVCIFQGMITGLLLIFSTRTNLSSHLLGTALIMLCIVSFRIVFHNVGWSGFAQIAYIPLGWELSLPPLFYLYVKSLTQNGFIWQNRYWAHFLPIAIYLAYDFFIYFISLASDTREEQYGLVAAYFYHQTNEVEDYLIVFSSLVYTVASLKLITRFRSATRDLKQKQAEVVFRWIKTIFIIMGIAALFLSINEIIDLMIQRRLPGFSHWKAFNLYLAISIYYIGIKGYKSATSVIHKNRKHMDCISSKLENKDMADVEKRLGEQLETQRVYLNPDITLDELAKLIKTSPENLSFVINNKFSKSFRDLINSYRINAVKSRLQKSNHLTILDIALDCGFNSQASFYRAFKKFEGMTPKAYLDSIN